MIFLSGHQELAAKQKPMKPTAPLRDNFGVFAIDPACGLSLSR
jgi:hypothetical protein